MARFFEKAKQIDAMTDGEIQDYLVAEKLANKVQKERVSDFYNRLSNIAIGDPPQETQSIDYDYFNCKTEEDIEKINNLKELEKDYMDGINPELLKGGRLLKAAAALSYTFEKMMSGESGEHEDDPNEYLRNLFRYEDEPELTDTPYAFADLIEKDLRFLKYLALLNNKKAFAKLAGKLHRDDSGKIVKYREIENMSDLTSSNLMQIAMPDFDRKLASKDLYVKTRFIRKDRGQNLIILVDDSGSMSDRIKAAMLKAAIILKIKEISESHNVYIGTFERRIFGFMKIEKGTKFEDMTFIRLDGGTTDVNGCIKDAMSQIKSRKLSSYEGESLPLSDDHFEILVINDGQDPVDRRFHPNIKLHALCLMQSNNNLKNICHRSGGTYYHMKHDEEE